MMQKLNYDDYKDLICEMYSEGNSFAGIARKLSEITGQAAYHTTVARALRRWGVVKPNAFENTLEESNFSPVDNWEYGWIKSKGASVFVKNPDVVSEGLNEDVIRGAVEAALAQYSPREIKTPENVSNLAFRAVISDTHVGMRADGQDAVFGFKYDAEVFNRHLDIFFATVKHEVDFYGGFDTIFIDDLGDGIDSYLGQTTRGGHSLPQNMSNKDAWDVYVQGKLRMCIDIIENVKACNFLFTNVVNDNHNGDWGWSANKAIQMSLGMLYPDKVSYRLMIKPIEHLFFGDHCFILTHGKDKNLMFKNMPLNLTDKLANFFGQYIDHYQIRSKYIHVLKGDLHQIGYNRTPKLDYRNFMSFAPPSEWVQINMSTSYCGFSTQVIPANSNAIKHTDHFFDLGV